jgi:hypothetical protein
VYQIYLHIQGDCRNWIKDEMPKKYKDINTHIILGIKEQCSQIKVEDGIIMTDDLIHAFKCAKHSRETVVYKAQLLGNDLTNTSILVFCLDKWIHDDKTQNIVMNNVEIEIDKKCTGVVDDSNSAPDCANTPLPEGDVLAIVFGTICAFLIVIIAVLVGGGILW